MGEEALMLWQSKISLPLQIYLQRSLHYVWFNDFNERLFTNNEFCVLLIANNKDFWWENFHSLRNEPEWLHQNFRINSIQIIFAIVNNLRTYIFGYHGQFHERIPVKTHTQIHQNFKQFNLTLLRPKRFISFSRASLGN